MDITYPDYKRNISNIADSVLENFGVRHRQSNLAISLPEKRRTFLIVLDGLGWNLFSRLKISKQLNAQKISSVFPSTTATALTSILSGATPGQHGIIGYRAFIKESGGVVKPLRSTFAAIHADEILRQATPLKAMFSVHTLFESLREGGVKSGVIYPSGITYSGFSEMVLSGASEFFTYDNVWDAFEVFSNEMKNGRYRFYHFYVPFIDGVEHGYGSQSEAAYEAASFILSNLVSKIKKYEDKVNVMITADHGHINIERTIEFNDNPQLMRKLEIPPYGDGRAPLFRSRYDISKELAGYDLGVFGRDMRKLLFGAIDKRTEDRLPDYVGVPLDGSSYYYRYAPKGEKPRSDVSNHGGLSQAEMEVPLILL